MSKAALKKLEPDPKAKETARGERLAGKNGNEQPPKGEIAPLYDEKKGAYVDERVLADAKVYNDIVTNFEEPLRAQHDVAVERIKHLKGFILTRLRPVFPDRDETDENGHPKPGSWTHFCRTELRTPQQLSATSAEKGANVFMRSNEYIAAYAKPLYERIAKAVEDDAERKKLLADPAPIPAAHQIASLASVANKVAKTKDKSAKKKFEKQRLEIHEKLFTGGFQSAAEFEEALPRNRKSNKVGNGNDGSAASTNSGDNSRKAYELDALGSGSLQDLKRALDSFGCGEAVLTFVGNMAQGPTADIISKIEKEIEDINTEQKLVYWMAWVADKKAE